MKKKRLFLACCCTLLLFAVQLSAQTVSVTVNNIRYECLSDTAIIVGYASPPQGDLVLPNTITAEGATYTVAAIEREAFSFCDKLTSIQLPASLKAIGEYAFYYSGLTSLQLPASLTTIGANAFSGCYNMKDVVTLGTSEPTIGSYAFSGIELWAPNATAGFTASNWGASTIHYGKIPPLYTTIDNIKYSYYINGDASVVGYVNNPTGALVLPNTITAEGATYTVAAIEREAFSFCDKLTSVQLPDSLKAIGERAFQNCHQLTSVQLPDSLKTIGNGAFSRCSKLTSIQLPASLKAIGELAFQNCSNLTSLQLPASLTTIGANAFSECYNLKNVVTLGTSEPTIGSYAFSGIELWVPNATAGFTASNWGASTIHYGKIPPLHTTIDNIKYSYYINGDASVVGYTSELKGALVLPNTITVEGSSYTVTAIAARALRFCQSLTSIQLPDSLKTIEEDAFSRCSNLTSIQLPASVKTIGERAFSECYNLASLQLPASVKTIGAYAFSECYNLKNVVALGTSEPTIGSYAFSGIELWVPNATAGFTASNWGASTIHYGKIPPLHTTIDNIKYSYYINGDASVVGYTSELKGALVLPNTITVEGSSYIVTTIEASAFEHCGNITSLQLPDSLKTIGEDAFSRCSNLTSIQLPASVKTIGERAFQNCSYLASLQLPASVKTIGAYAFSECYNLKNVVALGTSEPTIGSYAFPGIELWVPNATAGFTASNWGASTIHYGKIPPLHTTIDNIKYSYYINGDASVVGYTSELKGALVLPNTITVEGSSYIVTTIEASAFEHCGNITSLQLPDSLKTIGEDAFSRCSNLTSIQLPASVKTIGERAFQNCSYLASLQLPASVKTIGAYAFSECYNLKNVVALGTSEPTIGSYAFSGIELWAPNATEGFTASNWDASTIHYGKMPPLYTTIDNIKYGYYIDGDASVVGYTWGLSGDLTLPNTITVDGATYTVTAIAPRAFSGCYNLTSVQLPASLTTIGAGAFSNCYSLSSLQLPASLTTIEANAFSSCGNLTSIELPASLTTIGANAFSSCGNLTSIELPASLTTIGERAFSSCSNLKDVVTLGTTEPTIGSFAFPSIQLWAPNATEGFTASNWNATAVHYGKMPPLYTTIDNIKYGYYINGDASVVGYTWGLSGDLVLPNTITIEGDSYTVTTIEANAFSSCSNLISIELPASLTTIGSSAFSSCRDLTSVQLPASLTTIEANAFEGCGNIATVELPASLTTIGANAFRSCYNMKDVVTLGTTEPTIGNNAFTSYQLELWVPNATEGFTASNWGASTIHYGKMPPLYTTIDNIKYGYYINGDASVVGYIRGLSGDLTLPNTITVDGATYTVTAIAPRAFSGCYNLTSIQLPDSLRTIGAGAFTECSKLNDIQLPASLTTIDGNVFVYCSSLRSISVDADNKHYKAIDGVLLSIDEQTLICYPKGKPDTAYTVPPKVTTIDSYAFSNCQQLTELRLPESLTTIGESAFSSCQQLTELRLPESLTTIGKSAFSNCDGLTELRLPASLTTIGESAFSDCSRINNVVYMGTTEPTILEPKFRIIDLWLPNATDGFTASKWNASAIHYGENLPTYVVVDNIKYTYSAGKATVVGCELIPEETLVIPNSVMIEGDNYTVTELGKYTFRNSKLKNIQLPNSLTTIGGYAFSGCWALKTLQLPASVTTIGESAFASCYDLKKVITLGTSEPTIGADAFPSIQLWVPNATTGFTASKWNATAIHYAKLVTIDNLQYSCEANGSASVVGYESEPQGDLVIPTTITTEGETYTVTTIGAKAFEHSELTSIQLPASVTAISVRAFANCSNLKHVTTLGTSEPTIEADAFMSYLLQLELWVPNATEGFTASNWNALAVHYGKMPPLYTTIDNIKYRCESNGSATAIGYESEPQGDLVLPNTITVKGASYTVTAIGARSFESCTGVRSLELPNSLTTIEENAFADCWGITSIQLSDSLTTIGANAFKSCWELTTVQLPASIKTIGRFAFTGCSSLKHVTTLGTTEPTIGTDAFTSYLLELWVPNATEGFTASNWNASVIHYGKMAPLFIIVNRVRYYCESDGTAKVAKHQSLFQESLMIPNSITAKGSTYTVTTIEANAFEGCWYLKNLQLPASLTTIGARAFVTCNELTEVTYLGTIEPEIGDSAFRSIELWVPNVANGFTASKWNATAIHYGKVPVDVNDNRAKAIRIIGTQEAVRVLSGDRLNYRVINLHGKIVTQGRITSTDQRITIAAGIYFVQVGERTEKVVVR